LAGPRPADVLGTRATPPAHGVVFPTGTVIEADGAHHRSFSALWRGAPYRTGRSKGLRRRIRVCPRRGGTARTYLLRRNRPGSVRVGDCENHLGEHTKNTVLDGNLPRDHGGPYRTCGESLPSLWGKNSVPVGKLHRTGGERLPFSTGRITVPVGKDYRTGGEVRQRFFLQI
jgi:hypothetical protein